MAHAQDKPTMTEEELVNLPAESFKDLTLYIADDEENSLKALAELNASPAANATHIVDVFSEGQIPTFVDGVPLVYVKEGGDIHRGSAAIRFLKSYDGFSAGLAKREGLQGDAGGFLAMDASAAAAPASGASSSGPPPPPSAERRIDGNDINALMAQRSAPIGGAAAPGAGGPPPPMMV